jgi:predicted amidohydrolase
VGWAPESPLFSSLAADYSRYLESYQSLAARLHINIVPGTIVERHTVRHEEVLYNTAYFISASGAILGSYRKKNIWHPERPHLTSSGHDPHEVFDTPLGKVGLLICWDLAFPEAFRELISKGAEIVVAPTYCTFTSLQSKRVSGFVDGKDRGPTRRLARRAGAQPGLGKALPRLDAHVAVF